MDGWMDGWVGGWMIVWIGWMDGWVDGWLDVCMDGFMDSWMNGMMHGWKDAWKDGWMDGFIYHTCCLHVLYGAYISSWSRHGPYTPNTIAPSGSLSVVWHECSGFFQCHLIRSKQYKCPQSSSVVFLYSFVWDKVLSLYTAQHCFCNMVVEGGVI